MWNWFRDNAAAIGVLCIVLGLFGGLVKFALVDPMHQRFDALDQRFDAIGQRFDDLYKYVDERFNAVDQRLDSLTSEVSELRKLTARITERISRNEGEIDVIRQQLQTADKPTP